MFRIKNSSHFVRQPDGQVRKCTMWVGGRRLAPGATASYPQLPTDAEPHIHSKERNPFGVLFLQEVPDVQEAPAESEDDAQAATETTTPKDAESPSSPDTEESSEPEEGGEGDTTDTSPESGKDPEQDEDNSDAGNQDNDLGPGDQDEESGPGDDDQKDVVPDPADATEQQTEGPPAACADTADSTSAEGDPEGPPVADGGDEKEKQAVVIEVGGSCEMPYKDAVAIVEGLESAEDIQKFTEGETRVRVTRAATEKLSTLEA